MPPLHTITGFQWDKGNKDKNLSKHNVSDEECEEIFFDECKKVLHDNIHSGSEPRFILLGKTKQNRTLFVVFTIRRHTIRIISARDINKKEYPLYEKNH